MKNQVEELIKQSLLSLKKENDWQFELPNYVVENTKDRAHGDLACNVALVLSKPLKQNPRQIAQTIQEKLKSSEFIEKIEIAGPGFINFFLANQAFQSVVPEILRKGKDYGKANIGNGQRILFEFVSCNPTGPLHVGHGRHAAYGATLANILTAMGYTIHREYYVNDAGRQIDILAASVWLRYLEICGETFTFPLNAYKGSYVLDIAKQVFYQFDRKLHAQTILLFKDIPEDTEESKEKVMDLIIERSKVLLGEEYFREVARITLELILQDIREDLAEFGVTFDRWFSEYEFTKTNIVDKTIKTMQEKGLVYESEGALWFKATEYGDEKDRVLQRANGQKTYFANDLAYHINKFERGFDSAIDIFGSDHHGYVPRMKAGLSAFGISADKLNYLLVQFVTLYRGNKQVQMSTRSGSFVTLRELREEVGNDSARFFYVRFK